MTPSDPLNPLEVALAVARALDRAGVPYFLGGSLASSVQGEPRATNDIDFVVELTSDRVASLRTELGPAFDIDEEALQDAARRRSSWNIFHLPSMTKVDLFILRDGDFDRVEFSRRGNLEVGPDQYVMIKTPEDTVLRKLLWYRQGGEVSSQQWRDVREVLRVSGPTLDVGYMDEWAQRLGVSGLLARAWAEARSGA